MIDTYAKFPVISYYVLANQLNTIIDTLASTAPLRLTLFFGFLSLLFLPVSVLKAQQLQVGFTSAASLSSTDYQALWLSRSSYGYITDEAYSSLAHFSARDSYQFNKNVGLDYGATLTTGYSQNTTAYFREAYIRLKVAPFSLYAGRFYKHYGTVDAEKSLGGFGISHNALPMPRIGFSLDRYIKPKFLGGFIGAKGEIFNGWFENDRTIKNAMLHHKNVYVGLFPFERFSIEGGFLHFAQWGGRDKVFGKLTTDFKSTFFVTSDKKSDIFSEQNNKLGNHLGLYDFIIKYQADKWDYKFVWQHPFDDKSGFVWRNLPDNFFTVSLLNKKVGKDRGFAQITYEFQYTKHQSGRGMTDPYPLGTKDEDKYDYLGNRYNGRDQYHNNYIYLDGFTYEGVDLSNALYYTNRFIQKRIDDFQLLSGLHRELYSMNAIGNNRVVAHNVYSKYLINASLNIESAFTFSRNYGTYNVLDYTLPYIDPPKMEQSEYNFYGGPYQVNTYVRVNKLFRINQLVFVCKAAVAVDYGELYKNTAMLLELQINL